jgi:hypothetical protein
MDALRDGQFPLVFAAIDRRPVWQRWAAALLVASGAILLAVPAFGAAEPGDVGRTPPRLSLIEGAVSFWRPGDAEWSRARLNTPLAPGDALHSGADSRLELQIGAGAFARTGSNTQVELASQEPDFVQLRVVTGRLAVDLRDIAPGHTVQIDAPNVALTLNEAGYYRVDVDGERTTVVTRRGGEARVRPRGAAPVALSTNRQMVVENGAAALVATHNAPPLDDWDRWNYERTDHVLAADSYRYVPRGVYGADTLDHYGSWRVVPSYGPVWVPRYVSPAWAPYSTGSWVWDAYYGWTWIDDAPWGWAPFHYGRWVYVSNYWAWAPGPIVAPVYAPALVAFFGGHGFHVSVGVPFVSWVALGWGEPIVPWWGPHGFIGVPCWRGWGGPHIINNVVIHRTRIVRDHPRSWANTRVRDAVVSVPRDRFGSHRVDRVRDGGPKERDLRPLHGRDLPAHRMVAGGREERPPRHHPGVPSRVRTDVAREERGSGPVSRAGAPTYGRREQEGRGRSAGAGAYPSDRPPPATDQGRDERRLSAPSRAERAPGRSEQPQSFSGEAAAERGRAPAREMRERSRPPVPPRAAVGGPAGTDGGGAPRNTLGGTREPSRSRYVERERSSGAYSVIDRPAGAAPGRAPDAGSRAGAPAVSSAPPPRVEQAPERSVSRPMESGRRMEMPGRRLELGQGAQPAPVVRSAPAPAAAPAPQGSGDGSGRSDGRGRSRSLRHR